jgi:HEAT repeat protein
MMGGGYHASRRALRLILMVLSLLLNAMRADSAAQNQPRLSDSGSLLDLARQAQDRSLPEAERLNMIRALGQWGTEQVRAPLLALLADPLPSIRAAAARGLGWRGNREAVSILRGLVEAPAEGPALRAAALQALGRIGDDSARPAVLSATQDPDRAVRDAALRAVTFDALVDPADRPALLRQVAADRALDLLLRSQAIQALAEVKDTGAADLLIRLIEQEPPFPMPPLTTSGSRAQVMAIRYAEQRDVRAWAARAAGVLADTSTALPVVLKAAEDPADFFLRMMSVETLGSWKAREAIPVLLRRLDDAFEYARAAALRALAQIGDRSAVDAVLPRLSDEIPMVRAQAAYTLGALGDPKVRPQLEALLHEGETHPDVRQALQAALTQLPR